MHNSGMDSSRFAQLTEPQRDCLRRVANLQSSKEIARDFGVSRHAIDQRLERAIRTLGAQDRFDAARMLSAHENGASERFTCEPPAIAPADPMGTIALPVGEPANAPDSGSVLRDGARMIDAYLPPLGGQRVLERERPKQNDQTTQQRLVVVILLSIAVILEVGFLLAVMIGFGIFLDETAP